MQPSTATLAERHADEALAMRAVLHTAHERARALSAQLELEAPDPRVGALFHRTRAIQRDIALLILELAADEPTTTRDRDCRECLVSSDRCEAGACVGAGRCCGECSHG